MPDLARRLRKIEKQRTANYASATGAAAAPIAPPDVATFVEQLRIPDRARGGLVPFALYPRQREALDLIAASDRLVSVKARQVGITTLALGFALYATQYGEHRDVLLTRQSLEDCKDSVRRAKRMHASIPAALHPQPLVDDNATSLSFENGSRIDALTSTSSVGRGRSAYLAVCDEVAFWPDAETQMTALEAAAERVLVVSTGNGSGDYLHRLWQQATAGKGRYVPLFLDWRTVPGRTHDWYRSEVLEAIEPRLARREYPGSVDEAFASPEGIFYERFDTARNVVDAEPVPVWRTVRAVDFGWHHAVCLWVQTSPQGQHHVVAELLSTRQTTAEFAKAILAQDNALGVSPAVSWCDPAGRGVSSQTAQSEFEIFAAHSLAPHGSASNVRDGVLRVMAAIADPNLPLLVHRSGCPWLIEALNNVKPDRHRPDLPDESSDYAHALDALRYACLHLPIGPPRDDWEPPEPTRAPGGFGTGWACEEGYSDQHFDWLEPHRYGRGW